MNLFKKTPNITELAKLTRADAEKIYDFLATGLSATEVFTQKGYKIKHTEQVLAEMNRMEALAIKTVKDNASITKPALAAKLSSNLLDAAKVVDDIVKYNPSIKKTRTFADFKTEITATEA